MSSINWTCPYCNRDQAATHNQIDQKRVHIENSQSIHGPIGFEITTVRCANAECSQLELSCSLQRVSIGPLNNIHFTNGIIKHWQLLPESLAKPQPEYIPQQIVEDYTEACRIRDLSPKASATLSRRCIQGMIRDFCSINKPTLFKEINALREAVNEGDDGVKHVHVEEIEAIDHVRKIGNIGAHMENDVNLIIDVDPSEAQILIDLIELLFKAWYVQRETRQQMFNDLKDVAQEKELEKKG